MEGKKTEIISKEEIEKVLETLNQAEEKCPVDNDSNLDLAKVKETISSFEGCTPHTVVGILSTAFLILPASAIMAVLDMGKQALRAKALSEFMKMVGENCPACSEKEAPEAPAE